MRRGKDASLKALISAMAEAESKSYYEEQENALNDLSGLLKTFLNRDDSPERVRIRKDYEAGAALTGKGGIRQRLGAVDMEFFGRAYFPHYFSRPSPEFHRELDAIWQDGVLKGLTPSTPKLVKQISRMNGCKRVVAAPRGHAKSTSLTFKGTIHAVVYGYKHYPIIISDSSDQAEGFLDNIRVEFEENEAIREDFGDLTGKVWRSNVLVTSTNIKVEAIGSGKKIRGRKHRNWRPDLLILDDIENDENVRTPEQRAKLDSWFKKAVSKAGDDYTDIVYIGTLLHYDSLLANTLKNPGYKAIKYRAVISFSPEADLRAEDAHMVGGKGYLGISYHVKGLMDFPVEIDIPGKFSIYNSLTAIAICRHFKVSQENIIKALKVARVKGRIEMIKVSDEFTLMIDYAHNAMALESLLTTLREYHPHRLVCLFGCGGNRAKSRRYEMGEVSGRMADLTIITSDNPRFEEPQAIIDDIKTGIAKTNGKYVEICDRKEAIAYAIHHGEPGDIIVLAGKGHEDYQEIKGKKYPMDERVLIAEILKEDQEKDQ